ncbi:uncharacterized protein [Ptychodera flava]|uniref:uncharacterized protein n=1 Tax=Ptychodera flava TaxID=63121 RepID=UPI00396AAED3
MPLNCCVPGCTGKGYRRVSGHKVSFFNFPRDTDLVKKWRHAIRRDPNAAVSSTKVCSLHFKEDDFRYTLTRKRLLCNSAVPSQFAWTNLIQNRKTPVEWRAESTNSTVKDTVTTKTVLGECQNTCDTVNAEELIMQHKLNIDKLKQDNLQKDIDIEKLKSEIEILKDSYEKELMKVRNEITELKNEIIAVDEKHCQIAFSVHRFLDSDNDIAFYTGFPDTKTFLDVFEFLDTGENGENVRYWNTGNEKCNMDNSGTRNNFHRNKLGRPRSLEPLDEFFLILCRLRQGFPEHHLANLFNISSSTVSRIVVTWVNYMYLKLGSLDIWPSRDVISATMPLSMKEKYPSTRVIIDCTEINVRFHHLLFYIMNCFHITKIT